jgi:predicted adenylyl cyclase CyaB
MNHDMRNIELKVRVPDLDVVRASLAALGARYEGSNRQVDTYFRIENGRLKLRQLDDRQSGTLIYYRRADTAVSRYSAYQLVETADGDTANALLSSALGVLVEVTKRRRLFVYGCTRIHLDAVDDLGCFVELETVIRGQSEAAAHDEHDLVKTALRLDTYPAVAVSYGDLRIGRNGHRT